MSLRLPAFVLLLACGSGASLSAADVPYLTGRVVDNAEIIAPDAEARLTAALTAHEEATGNQIAVLTVPTIQPDSIEDYAVRVFASWKRPPMERSMPPTTMAVVTPRPPIAMTEAYLRTESSVVGLRKVSSAERKKISRMTVMAITP